MISPLFKKLVNGVAQEFQEPQELPRRRESHLTIENAKRILPAVIVRRREEEHQEDLMLFVRLVQKRPQ